MIELAALALKAIISRLVDLGVKSAGKAPWPWKSQFVPLPETMRKLHEATVNSFTADFARSVTRDPDEVLNWYAYVCVRSGVPVYGERPPSRLHGAHTRRRSQAS